MDTSTRAWRDFYSKLGIDVASLPRTRIPKENRWLILTPHFLTTQYFVNESKAKCSFKRFEDAFICKDLPADPRFTGSDIILSSRIRKSPIGWSATRVRALDSANQDRSWWGLSAEMAWQTINSMWHITLKEYLALWLLAKSQGKRLDCLSRTVCAGSSVLRPPSPLTDEDLKVGDVWLPAVGEDHGVLRVERVPPNFRHSDYATRRVYSVFGFTDRERLIYTPPEPNFHGHPHLSDLMV